MTNEELLDELIRRMDKNEIPLRDILQLIDDWDLEQEFSDRGLNDQDNINNMTREQIEQYLKENFKKEDIDILIENVYYDYVENSKHLTKSLDSLFLTINKQI